MFGETDYQRRKDLSERDEQWLTKVLYGFGCPCDLRGSSTNDGTTCALVRPMAASATREATILHRIASSDRCIDNKKMRGVERGQHRFGSSDLAGHDRDAEVFSSSRSLHYKKGAHYNVSKSIYIKDANLSSGGFEDVLAAIMNLVLERNVKSVDFGMLELPSGNLAFEEYIKLATSVSRSSMSLRLTSAKVLPAGSGSRK